LALGLPGSLGGNCSTRQPYLLPRIEGSSAASWELGIASLQSISRPILTK
jgi:hypothetical protein